MKGIYKIVNVVNGNVYIGSSKSMERRIYDHRYKLNGNKHKNQHIQRSWNKYGEGGFKFEVIEECENLIEREQYWLDFYKLNGKVYNQRLECVASVKGIKFGPRDLKTKNKISKANKGRKHKEETRNKISETLKKHTIPKEVKDKISEALKGHIVTEETRNKIRNGHIGKKLSEETKRKLSEIRKGKPWSEKRRGNPP